MIEKVYGNDAAYTGHIPPEYGDWPLSQDELKTRWQKHDLPAARRLMNEAGFGNGFDATMNVVGLSEFPTLATLMKSQLANIKINLNLKTQDLASFAADY